MSEIGEAEVRSYVDDGFLVVPSLFSADEVAEMRADVARFARGEYPLANAPWGEDQAPAPAAGAEEDGAAMAKMLCVHFPHWVSPVMRAHLSHPAVAEVLSRITAAHLPHWDGSVKAMQSMLFVKPPGLPGQAWHQDERYIPTRDRSLVGAWIALDDATLENGCLWVLPGSHRNGYIWPTRDHGDYYEYDESDQAYGFDESGAAPVEVAAGSVVFFNGYLLHKSHRNRSGGYRRALVNHYCNAWSLLPWFAGSKLPGDVATADNRATVLVAGRDPYEWKGHPETPSAVFLRPYKPAETSA